MSRHFRQRQGEEQRGKQAHPTAVAMFLQPKRRQTELHGYAVEFSPFVDNLIAVGTAQYFGIIGNGRQNVFEVAPTGELVPIRAFDTPEGVYDCAWSELNAQQLVSACANGALKLWHLQTRDNFPIQNYHEHKQEVSGVNWSLVTKDSFVSASWDGTIKLWKPEMPHSLLTLAEHTKPVYNAVWNTQNAGVVASCSGDGTLKIWDLNSGRSVTTIMAHNNEVLAMDWNKYNPFEVVSGSADCSIKVWDTRNPSREVRMLPGHNYAIRRIKCSPHDPDVIATASYDMSVGIWNTKSPYPRLQTAPHHREFVFGIDFSLFVEGLVASCSWDRQVAVWNYFGGPPYSVNCTLCTGKKMALMASGEARMKAGLWTQHIDPASGRKYYFNMVHNRSYWELPDELLGEVKAPMIETLREWDAEAAARYEQPQQAMTAEEQLQRRRREELLRAAHASESVPSGATGNMGALEERMALAAQKRTESLAVQQQKPKEEESSAADNANNGYLKMVRELQAKDRDTEDSGGKWLVR